MITAFIFLAIGNAAEYYLIKRENLKHIRGVVLKTEREFYKCKGRKYGYSMCQATVFYMESGRKFRISADAWSGDGYVDIGAGDTIDIYMRKWYQRIVTLGFSQQIYQLEKDGYIHYSMSNWKRSNFTWMMLSGIFTLFFVPFYFYQRSYMNKFLSSSSGV